VKLNPNVLASTRVCSLPHFAYSLTGSDQIAPGPVSRVCTPARISAYLYEAYAADEGILGDLDRWTQRRITDENMAKLALVMSSEDPAETCYRDLIREIDTEAETGIYLVREDATTEHLRSLADDPGISGGLYRHIDKIAPVVLADETRRSVDDLDLVWITIRAYHDRAHVDAMVSEIIMSHFLDDAEITHEMTDAMRALHYSFHEDVVRRRLMVTELAKRSGSYDDRTAAIGQQAFSA
jgi:hypothetical protein